MRSRTSFSRLLKLVFAIYFCVNASVKGQSIDEITTSGRYLFGYGTGKSFELADKNALDNLTSQISVSVQSRFTSNAVEDNRTYQRQIEDFVQTQSGVTLEDATSRLISEKKGEVKVIRFIAIKDSKIVFSNRMLLTRELYGEGLKAREDLRISDALRNFYWSFALLRSIPGRDTVRYYTGNQRNDLLITSLPNILNDIFSDIKVEISEIQVDTKNAQTNITLRITYKKHLVENFDFTYWNGDSWSCMVSTTEGIAQIEFPASQDVSLEKLDLRAEYEFLNKVKMYNDIECILNCSQLPRFDKASKRLTVPGHSQKHVSGPDSVNVKIAVQPQKAVSANAESTCEVRDIKRYGDILNAVLNAAREGRISQVNRAFTPLGFEMMSKLLSNGKVTVLDHAQTIKPVWCGKEVEFRSVPMKFSFSNNHREFIENVVFSFDSSGLIGGIAFSLGNHALDDILNRSANFGTTQDKYTLIRFMENYKTAYSLKRIDYIDSIFAENALIIVGKVLEPAHPGEVKNIPLGGKQIVYQQYTKGEFLKKLSRLFKSNEFINIQFEETNVTKKNDEKLYGIQIEQHYYSSTYADKGYLFLMIDLNDALKPKIYVRTWQPGRNEDGSIPELGDFHY